MAKFTMNAEMPSKEREDVSPSLDSSSVSGGEEEGNAPSSRPPTRPQTTLENTDSHRRELLQAALRIEQGVNRHNSLLDQRTSVSLPTRVSSLRGKLGRLSRTQRRSLLRRNSSKDLETTPSTIGLDTIQSLPTCTSVLSHQESEARNDIVTQLKQEAKVAQRQGKPNTIKLHVYDLIHQDTLMQMPWGCMCEIGKCFNDVNSALHQLGTGAYHVGVEVNGTEYAYGATNVPGKSGIFACHPMQSPGYQYRQTIDLGARALLQKRWVEVEKGESTVYQEVEEFVEGKEIVRLMQSEYMGVDYDILRKNCCTFAHDTCVRLGVPDDEIPSWFRNLAESGAATHDLAIATMDSFEPLSKALSSCAEDERALRKLRTLESENGFEVVSPSDDGVAVVDTKESPKKHGGERKLARTSTWAC